MEVNLVNFRCHINRTFLFSSSKISLLDGEPEDGKTTVLQAIFWALYGSLRNINHHLNGKTSQTQVTLKFEQLSNLGREVTIYRQNHSNRLLLTIEQPLSGESAITYEDDLAQEQINQTFGRREVWKSVSYIEQGSQCSLLSGTKQERLALLEELSFHQDDPHDAIAKIDDQLVQEREKFKLDQNSFDTECQLLKRELEYNPLPNGYSYTDQSKQQLETELAKLQQQRQEEEINNHKRAHLQGSIKQLEETITNLQNQFNQLPAADQMTQQIEQNKLAIDQVNNELAEVKRKIASQEIDINERRQSLHKDQQQAKQEQEFINRQIQQIKQYTQQLTTNQQAEQVKLTTLQQQQQTLQQQSVQLNQTITQQEDSLAPLPDKNDWPTLIQVGQVQQIEADRLRYQQLAQSLQVDYQDNLQAKISEWEKYLQDEKFRLDRYQTVNQLIKNQQEKQIAEQEIKNRLQQLNKEKEIKQEQKTNLTQQVDSLQRQTAELSNIIIQQEEFLAPLPEKDNWPTLIQVGQVKQIEADRIRYQQLAQSLQVVYQDDLPTKISQWEKYLQDERSRLDRYRALNQLIAARQATRTTLQQNQLIIKLNNQTDISTILNHINQQKNQLSLIVQDKKGAFQLLSCPKCGETLRIENNTLTTDPRQPTTEEEVAQLQIQLENLTQLTSTLLNLSSLWQTLQPQLNLLEQPLTETDQEFSLSEIEDRINQYDQYINKLRQIRWIPPPAISGSRLEELIELQNQYQKRDQQNNQVQQINQDLTHNQQTLLTFEQQIEEQNSKLADLKSSIDQIDQQLSELVTDKSISESDQIQGENDCQKKIDQLIQYINNLRQIRWIPPPTVSGLRLEQLVQLDNHYTTRNQQDEQLEQIEQEINQLKQLVSNLDQQIEAQNQKLPLLNNSADQINQRLADLKTTEEKLVQELAQSSINAWREEERQLIEQLNYYHQQIAQLEANLTRKTNLCAELDNNEQILQQYQLQLTDLGLSLSAQINEQIQIKTQTLTVVTRGIQLTDWQNKLLTKQTELTIQQGSLAALEELRRTAETVQYKQLEETIISINLAMNDVFTQIFDNDIEVELKLFKELKSNKQIKPLVNCLIHYKGITYESLSTICGSEKNRLNLGMILALNLVSTSPIILLDECISFLNARLKSRSAAAIRKCINTISGRKIVICVCHQANEADYDEVVAVKETKHLDAYYPVVDQK